MEKSNQNRQSTLIGHSGNSDVDLTVNIDIDTKAIAYGIICSLYAKGDLNEQELQKAIHKLDSLLDRENKKKMKRSDYSKSTPQIYNFPKQNNRNWI